MEDVSASSAASGLTERELKELEAAPKTKLDNILDRVICFLPVLMGAIAILEYMYVPNAKQASTYETTYCYVIFIGALIAIALSMFIASIFSKRAFDYLRYHAPFYTLVFFLFFAYDVCSIKLAILQYPYFPSVDQIITAALGDTDYLADCIQHSVQLLFTGYFSGAILGLITGIACGYSKHVSYWLDPFLKILGAIPSTTWIPVVMVLAASLFQGAVFIIALGVWFSVTLATSSGIRNIDPSLYEAARTLGASTRQLVARIAVPSSLPNIFQGLIQAMSSACTALLVAEMIGVESGLGWYITWQKSWAQYGKMYAAIVIICVIFVLVNFILKRISDYVLRWRKGLGEQ